MRIEKVNINDITMYENNAKEHPNWQIEKLSETIKKIGYRSPIVVDENNMILAGHGRYMALKKLGYGDVQVVRHTDLTEEDKKAYMIADNQYTLNTGFNMEMLKQEIEELESVDFDTSLLGFDEIELQEIMEDEIEETAGDNQEVAEDDAELEEPKNIVIKSGDLIELGKHRVMCGDSTDSKQIKLLLNNEKAHLVFTDPPYGMKKEKDGVTNDNLNFYDLLDFNKKWIPLSFENLTENGSWYCWGIDEPLMDIYSNLLKPKIENNEITFRNLITWDKGNGQGQNSEDFRMYPIADEKCLFVIKGVQGFNTNSDNYFEGWEPIRHYLLEQRNKCGWDIPTMKTIAGHSDKSRDHWTDKSQWNLPTKDVYLKFQEWAIENNVDAFKREYEEIKREYEEIKKSFYETRAYFNNTHDNMNNVWHFNRVSGEDREETGGHATPKPVGLCARAIKSSSRENEKVLDLFGGSGSTLIACEQLNRKAYLMELETKWVQVIIERYLKFTGEEEIKINGKTVNWEEYKNG